MTFYIPRHFRVDDAATLERFVEANAFGTLVTAGPAGLSVSHVPFLLERGDGGRLRLLGHVARANAHWDVAGVAAALEAEGQAELAALMRAHASRPPESR